MKPANPVLVTRGGVVLHRKTRRELGQVRQVPLLSGREDAGEWVAWPDDAGDGLPDSFRTQQEAALALLQPSNHRPLVGARICHACRNTIPRPRPCRTGQCESEPQAEQRSRGNIPAQWELYDFLASLLAQSD